MATTPEYMKAWRAKNKAHVQAYLKTYMKSYVTEDVKLAKNMQQYGLTAQQFKVMLEEQEGCCASCGDPLGKGRDRALDHCHATGKVRGILCRGCNLAAGHLRDCAARAQKLSRYLEKHHGSEANKR